MEWNIRSSVGGTINRAGLIEVLTSYGDNSIDLSSEPDGLYLYRVITQDGGLVGEGKLIIQK